MEVWHGEWETGTGTWTFEIHSRYGELPPRSSPFIGQTSIHDPLFRHYVALSAPLGIWCLEH